MTVIYIGLASVALSLIMLWGVSKFMAQKSTGTKTGDVASALRELLIARADGRIDQAEFDRQQAALHAAVLEAPQAQSISMGRTQLSWIVAAVALIAVVGLFWQFAPPSDPAKSAAVAEPPQIPDMVQKPQANSGGDLNTVVKRLADKMANDPNNGEGWLLLAKTYGELRKYPEAAAAYEKAAALVPADATMLADWADAYVMSHDRKWDEASRKIVKRAVAADPKHVKSLALAGSEAFDRGAYKVAIDFWTRMKAVAPAESMDSKLADANIAEATAMLSGKKPAATATLDIPPALGPASVSGEVSVSAKLSTKISAKDTVFVIAKAPGAGGPPLAVKRFTVADLPAKFQLDDSAAIMPGRSISQFPEVIVTAKLSKTGQAEQQAGDLYGAPVTAKLGAANLKLELNQER